ACSFFASCLVYSCVTAARGLGGGGGGGAAAPREPPQVGVQGAASRPLHSHPAETLWQATRVLWVLGVECWTPQHPSPVAHAGSALDTRKPRAERNTMAKLHIHDPV